jgi:DNA polymerase III subunit delta
MSEPKKQAERDEEIVQTEPAAKKQVYLFCGEDSFSANEKLILWKSRFVDKYQEINMLTYYGSDLTASEFQSAVETFPFLSEKKLIVLIGFLKDGEDEDQHAVAEMIKAGLPEHAVVVFFENGKPDGRTVLYKALKKYAQVEDYILKAGADLERWIAGRAAREGLQIGSAELRLLTEYLGSNLWNASNEIHKLALYANGCPVTAEMIEKLISPNLSSTVFKLTDYLGEKRVHDALRVFRILMDSGQEAMGVLFMLVRHFRIMAQVKELQDQGLKAGEIAKQLKEHPFVVMKMFGQCRKFSFEEIRRIYATLAEIDVSVKTGRIRLLTGDTSELEREIEMLMMKVGM